MTSTSLRTSSRRIAGWTEKSLTNNNELIICQEPKEVDSKRIAKECGFLLPDTPCVRQGGVLRGNRRTMLSERKKFRCFFAENGLNISGLGDILLSESRDSYTAEPVSEFFSSFVSAKGNENLPSFKRFFCSQKRNKPARDLSVFVSCWAFLRRFESRFLAGPSLPRTGNRPAFFVPERCLVRRNVNFPEAAMLPFDCPHSHEILSAGNPFVRLPLSYSPDKTQNEVW